MSTIEQYRDAIEELDDILMILNQNGTIEYVNRALRKQLDQPTVWFTGKHITDCFVIDENQPEQDLLKTLKKKGEFISSYVTDKGDVKYFSWKTKPFHQDGQQKTLAILRNITAEVLLQKKKTAYSKNLQQEVFKRHRQLEKEKQKAIDLHQAKAIFLSKMSHELRTPLTAICGYVELLQDKSVSKSEQKQYLSVINRNARNLLDMINETLDMVKLEQKKYKATLRTFSLSRLLNEVHETYDVLAKEKGIDLKFYKSKNVPEKIHSDPNTIRQILTNLIGNALKFTQKGKITLQVKHRTFSHKTYQKLYFYVEDTGVGIPKEYHKRVFQSFEQYLDQHLVQSRGTGLGLAISRQMARLLGGNVKLVHSKPSKGSTFVFSLPFQNPNVSESQYNGKAFADFEKIP